MAVFYLDTSALVKRYRTEEGTDFIDKLFEKIEKSEDRLATSFFSALEFISALRRLLKGEQITQEAFFDSTARFVADLEKCFIISSVDDTAVSNSVSLIIKHAIKTADSIQLSSVLHLKEVLEESKEKLLFVVDDEELSSVAQDEGLTVINPREDRAMQKLEKYVK
ncbi:type II toxin-antitoxin system VapC family toxin [Candidatus Aerophobetes bacterium]|nr:type II toxin-antitoxin system VapC family toxin [Candidatus Aerophobetes bacterium]